MKKTIITTLLIICSLTALKGQDLFPVVSDAKTAAMGDVGLSSSANAFSLYNYAGAIALDDSKWAAGYSFGGWMPSYDMRSIHTIAGYWKPAEKHSITAGFRYYLFPDERIMDINGLVEDTFTPYDITLDLGYGYAITSYLSVAANVRYLTGKLSSIDDAAVASAFGADLGLYFRKNNIFAGLAVSNIGTKINYGGEDKSMPAKVKAAGGYGLNIGSQHAVNGVLELAYAFLPESYTGFEAGIGVEYVYDNMVAVRGGYRLGNDKNEFGPNVTNFGSSSSYATVGLGFNFWKCSLDLSYLIAVSEPSLKNSFRASLGFKF